MFIHRIKVQVRGNLKPIQFNFQRGANQYQNQIVFHGKPEHAEILRQSLQVLFASATHPNLLSVTLSLSDSDGVNWMMQVTGSKLEVFANHQSSTLGDLKASLGFAIEATLFEEISYLYDSQSDLFVPLETIDLQTHPIYMSIQDHFLGLTSKLKFHLADQGPLSFDRCDDFFRHAVLLLEESSALSSLMLSAQSEAKAEAQFDENAAKNFFTQMLSEIELIQSIEVLVTRILDLSSLESASDQKISALQKNISGARQVFDTPKINNLIKEHALEGLVLCVVQYKGLSHLHQIITSGRSQLDLEQRNMRTVHEPLQKLAERIEREMATLKVDMDRIESAMGQKILTMDQFLDWIGRYFKMQVHERQLEVILQTGQELNTLTEKLRVKLVEWRQLNSSQKSSLPENRSLLVSEARAISRYKGQKSGQIIKKIQEWVRNHGAAHGRNWLKQTQAEKNASFQKLAADYKMTFTQFQDKNFLGAVKIWPEFVQLRSLLPVGIQNILFFDSIVDLKKVETALCIFEVIKKKPAAFSTNSKVEQNERGSFFAKLTSFSNYRQRLILVDDASLWQECTKLKFGQCTVDANSLDEKFLPPTVSNSAGDERKLTRHERVQKTLDILNYSKFNSGGDKFKK